MINCKLHWSILLALCFTSCNTYYAVSPSLDAGTFESATNYPDNRVGIGYHVEMGYRKKHFGAGLTLGFNRYTTHTDGSLIPFLSIDGRHYEELKENLFIYVGGGFGLSPGGYAVPFTYGIDYKIPFGRSGIGLLAGIHNRTGIYLEKDYDPTLRSYHSSQLLLGLSF